MQSNNYTEIRFITVIDRLIQNTSAVTVFTCLSGEGCKRLDLIKRIAFDKSRKSEELELIVEQFHWEVHHEYWNLLNYNHEFNEGILTTLEPFNLSTTVINSMDFFIVDKWFEYDNFFEILRERLKIDISEDRMSFEKEINDLLFEAETYKDLGSIGRCIFIAWLTGFYNNKVNIFYPEIPTPLVESNIGFPKSYFSQESPYRSVFWQLVEYWNSQYESGGKWVSIDFEKQTPYRDLNDDIYVRGGRLPNIYNLPQASNKLG